MFCLFLAIFAKKKVFLESLSYYYGVFNILNKQKIII